MTPSQLDDDQTEAKLTGVFRSVFDDPSLVLREEMTAADVEGWDSLNHIALIVAIERAFQVKFTLSDIARLNNVGELMGLIRQKQKK